MAGIDHFTKEQFEEALPVDKKTGKKLWECAGCVDGEFTYTMGVTGKNLDPNVRIEIRSSVGCSGESAGTGQDSIRAWLIWYDTDAHEWRPLGSKTQRWVTRIPGWDERLKNVLRTLYGWRLTAGDCPICHKPRGIFKVHDPASKNVGRVFARCIVNQGNCAKVSWVWLDTSVGNSGINGKTNVLKEGTS